MRFLSQAEFTEFALKHDETHPEWTAEPRDLGRTMLSKKPVDDANEPIINRLITFAPAPLYLALHEAVQAGNTDMIELISGLATIAMQNADIAADKATKAEFRSHHLVSAHHYEHVAIIAAEVLGIE